MREAKATNMEGELACLEFDGIRGVDLGRCRR